MAGAGSLPLLPRGGGGGDSGRPVAAPGLLKTGTFPRHPGPPAPVVSAPAPRNVFCSTGATRQPCPPHSTRGLGLPPAGPPDAAGTGSPGSLGPTHASVSCPPRTPCPRASKGRDGEASGGTTGAGWEGRSPPGPPPRHPRCRPSQVGGHSPQQLPGRGGHVAACPPDETGSPTGRPWPLPPAVSLAL